MLVGIWTNGSHLEMPVVLIFFFLCPYQLPVTKDGTSFTAKQYVVRLYHAHFRTAEAEGKRSLCKD